MNEFKLKNVTHTQWRIEAWKQYEENEYQTLTVPAYGWSTVGWYSSEETALSAFETIFKDIFMNLRVIKAVDTETIYVIDSQGNAQKQHPFP
jgi:hypothetical protein